MSRAFKDGDEDPFEACLKLTQLAEAMIEDPTALRRAYDFCGQRAEDASILFDCIRGQLAPATPPSQRIALIELLCRLSRLPEYRPLIANNLRELIEVCNIKQSRDKEARNTAKAFKNLLRAIGEESLKDYEEFRTMLNSVLGMSETEQRVQQRRQRVMEEIERDRENHRAFREASWSRPGGETAEDEFRHILKGFYALSSLDLKISKQNSQTFCSINGIPPETQITDSNVLIIHLEEAILDHRRLCSSKESNTRHASDDFEYLVKRLAKEYFFYSNLRDYDQPHVLYYEEDDDQRPLADYNFDKDPLAESQKKHVNDKEKDGARRKFYRERAFRSRVASERYRELAKGNLDRAQAKECRKLRQELDRALNGDLCDSLRALEGLCRDATTVFIISDDHLSIALARVVALDLASQIPPENVYSTTKFDAEWTIREIRTRAKAKPPYRILGRSSHLEKATERAFHSRHHGHFIRVKHLKDVRL